jgi:ubiquinone/menaquinone biosynthesis C-methylase UbiE
VTRNTPQNPQADQMADESMVRTLAAQARAVWPQEVQLIDRYELPPDPRILDAGSGTGEGAARLALHFPQAHVLGVDVIEENLARARARFAELAPRVSFERRSAYELELPAQSFDLTVCRHVLHSIPEPQRVIAELARVTRRGGYVHLLAEDYSMLHFEQRAAELDEFWQAVTNEFTARSGIDMRSGRNMFAILAGAGFERIAVNYVIVDTVRVPREVFADILVAWRDGFAEPCAQVTGIPLERVVGLFESMIEQVRNPLRYAVWMVPIISGRVP